MGGKANILNPEALEYLYKESLSFAANFQEGMEKIYIEQEMLYTISSNNSFKGEQGETIKRSMNKINEIIKELKDCFERNHAIIDDKLSRVGQLKRDNDDVQLMDQELMRNRILNK